MRGPRHDPTWIDVNGAEEFIGYAGELDVYYEDLDGYPHILVVCAHERSQRNGYNYDIYQVEGGRLIQVDRRDAPPTPYELCLVYEMATEYGVFEIIPPDNKET